MLAYRPNPKEIFSVNHSGKIYIIKIAKNKYYLNFRPMLLKRLNYDKYCLPKVISLNFLKRLNINGNEKFKDSHCDYLSVFTDT
jgi:hypothetical protein